MLCREQSGREDPARMGALNLAFIGDAVYEVMVRGRLVLGGSRPVRRLHTEAVRYVCARSQSLAYDALEGLLTEKESDILRRGRNCSSIRTPRRGSMMEYRRATAVEALIGYLYLSGQETRLAQLADVIFQAISADGKEAGKIESAEDGR